MAAVPLRGWAMPFHHPGAPPPHSPSPYLPQIKRFASRGWVLPNVGGGDPPAPLLAPPWLSVPLPAALPPPWQLGRGAQREDVWHQALSPNPCWVLAKGAQRVFLFRVSLGGVLAPSPSGAVGVPRGHRLGD